MPTCTWQDSPLRLLALGTRRTAGCVFGVYISLFWDTKDRSAFWETPKSFGWIKMLFSGYKKCFSEVKGVSSIVKLFLTFWKVKSGKGGVQRTATQKAAAKAVHSQQLKRQKAAAQTTVQATETKETAKNKRISTKNKSRTSSSKLYKQQHKEHQTATTQEKNTHRISKSSTRSSKSNTNSTNSNAAKAAAETRGPRRAGPRRSLRDLSGVFSWNFGGVFDAFFEIP